MPKTKEQTKAEEIKVYTIQGHTNFRHVPYTVKITVKDGRISTIKTEGGNPNLYIKDLCFDFERRHPTNHRDVFLAIKLAMIQRCEFVTDIER